MKKLLQLVSLLTLLEACIAAISNGFNMANFGTNEGIKITGNHDTVSSAGDFNGDGVGDLIVGASGVGTTQAGTVYVIFGNLNGASDINLEALDSNQGIKITGANGSGNLGSYVSDAGDFNGDGVNDIIIANHYSNQTVYVIFGSRTALSDINLASLTPSQGIKIYDTSSTSTWFGFSLGNKCDINGDGISDVSIMQPLLVNGFAAVYIIFGNRSLSSDIEISNMGTSTGIQITLITTETETSGGIYKNRLSCVGDFNGDNIDDLIIGHPYNQTGTFASGSAYILFGNRTGFYNFDISSLGTQGIAINHITADNSIIGVSTAGDFNNDGLNDVIVLMTRLSLGFLLFGNRNSVREYDLNQLVSAQGIRLITNLPNSIADSAASIGDFNGDGINDVMIGDSRQNSNAGLAYIVFGKNSGLADINLASLTSDQGMVLNGDSNLMYFGREIRNAGDFNGDSHKDILIATGSLQSYLILQNNSSPQNNTNNSTNSTNSNNSTNSSIVLTEQILTQEQKQVLDRIDSYKETTGVLISVSTAGLQIANPASIATFSAIVFVGQLQYIRYIDINYHPRLIYSFKQQSQNSASLNFGPLFPDKLKEDSVKYLAPKRFSNYDVNGLLLVNIWRTLTTFIILILAIILVLALGKIKLENKYLVLVYEIAKDFILWNYMITFILTNTHIILFFAIVEFQSLNLDDGFAIASLIINIFCFVGIILFLVWVYLHLYKISKQDKYLTKEEKIMAHSSTKVLFQQNKDQNFPQLIFTLIISVRVGLVCIIAAVFDSPVLQCSLMLVLIILNLIYLFFYRPQLNSLANLELVGYEILLFIVNVTCLHLARLEPHEQTSERAANIIIICNLAMNTFSFTISILKILVQVGDAIQKFIDTRRDNKNHTELNSPQTPVDNISNTNSPSFKEIKNKYEEDHSDIEDTHKNVRRYYESK